MQPLTSILVPVYNRRDFIAQCVHSALEQTHPDLEVVISDNASSDGTWEICQELARIHPRVRIFRNESNIGPVRNWKRCAAEAKGTYCKLLFSDDLLYPAAVERALRLMKHDVAFVLSSADVGKDRANSTKRYTWFQETRIVSSRAFLLDALQGHNLPVTPVAGLFRTADLLGNILQMIPSPTISDFPDHGAGPDALVYLLTSLRYPRVGFVHESLCFLRSHAGSITVSNKAEWIERRYHQAFLWFAHTHMPKEIALQVAARACLFEMKHQRRLLKPSDIIRNYISTSLPVPEVAHLAFEILRRTAQKTWQYLR